jgi:hypothetical protein
MRLHVSQQLGRPGYSQELADRRVFHAREQYAEQFGSDWGRAINAITRHADFYRNLPVIAGRLRRDKRTRRSPPDASTGLHVRIRR